MAVRKWIRTNLLLILTVLSVIFGIVIGFALRPLELSTKTIVLVGFPGEILLNLLKLLILPLIASSLISGLAQMNPKQSGRIGLLAICYYMATTLIAVITGIILVLIIHPGQQVKSPIFSREQQQRSVDTLDTILDLFRNMLPENLIVTTFEQVQTEYGASNISRPAVLDKPMLKQSRGMNVLGLIVFCIAFGVVLSRAGARGKVLVDLFTALDLVIMRLVHIVMWYSPIGILCLIAEKLLSIECMSCTAKMLGMYMVTVIVGLTIHALITLPSIYFLLTRKNPVYFVRGVLQAWLTAIGTSSSAATLPVTFRCLEENLKMDRRVTRFMLPVGATINMDGTALYEAVAAIFIAQVNGMELSLGQVIIVCLTATLASVGAAAVPSAGLVTMLMVLTAVGLPVDDVSLIIAVDWFLDRLRTSINVLGDAYGVGIVYHLCRHQLDDNRIVDSNNHPIDDIVVESKTAPSAKYIQNKANYSNSNTVFISDETMIDDELKHHR